MPSSKRPLRARSKAESVARTCADRPLRGHPERLLVRRARLVALQVTGRLVGPCEPRADHHRRRARGQRQRHVARVPHAAVGPHVRPARPGRGRALGDGRELRPPHAGRHPRGAHRARPDADLHDVRARVDEVARSPTAVTTLPATTTAPGAVARDRAQRADRLLLVPVRGVDDEHVDPGGAELLRPRRHVAVHAERRGDPQPAVGVERGGVDLRAQCAGAGQHPGEPSVVRRPRGPRSPAPGAESFSNTSRGEVPTPTVTAGTSTSARRVNRSTPTQSDSRDDAERAPAVVDHHDRAVRTLAHQVERVGHRLAGVQDDGGVPDGVPRLHPGDDVGDRGGVDVLRDDRHPSPARQRLGHPPPGHGGHVRRDHRDVAPDGSATARSTSNREATSERSGTRKTSS